MTLHCSSFVMFCAAESLSDNIFVSSLFDIGYYFCDIGYYFCDIGYYFCEIFSFISERIAGWLSCRKLIYGYSHCFILSSELINLMYLAFRRPII